MRAAAARFAAARRDGVAIRQQRRDGVSGPQGKGAHDSGSAAVPAAASRACGELVARDQQR